MKMQRGLKLLAYEIISSIIIVFLFYLLFLSDTMRSSNMPMIVAMFGLLTIPVIIKNKHLPFVWKVGSVCLIYGASLYTSYAYEGVGKTFTNYAIILGAAMLCACIIYKVKHSK